MKKKQYQSADLIPVHRNWQKWQEIMELIESIYRK
jgi:hypothetical protein